MQRIGQTVATLVLAAVLMGCEDFSPTVPYPGSLRIEAADGDGQRSTPNGEVTLTARVTHMTTGEPIEGIDVEWQIESGTGSALVETTTVTDANGSAYARIRLGSTIGAYTLRAHFRGLRFDPARFRLLAV